MQHDIGNRTVTTHEVPQPSDEGNFGGHVALAEI
jgi:hypothetical protein